MSLKVCGKSYCRTSVHRASIKCSAQRIGNMTESVEDSTSESEYCSPRVARQSAMYNPSSIGLRRSERICSKGKRLVSLEDATSDYSTPGVARQPVVNSPNSIGLRRSGRISSKGVQGHKQTISLKEKTSVTSVTDIKLRKPSLQQLLPEAACNFNNPVEECNAEAEGIQFGTTLGQNSLRQNSNDIAQQINGRILSGSSNIHSRDFGREDELVARISSRARDHKDQTNPSTRSQEPVIDLSPTEIAINAGFADKGTSRTIGDSFSGNRISLNFTHDDVEMTEGCTSRLLGIEITAEVPRNTFVRAMALAKPSDVLTSMPPSQATEKTPTSIQSQEFLLNSTPQNGGKTNILTPVGMQGRDISAGSTQSIGGSVLHMASAFDEDGTSPASDNSNESVSPYFVSAEFAPTLTAIIKTHGDIAKDCPLKSNRMITSALERVCKAFRDLQEIRFNDLRHCHLQSLKAVITDAEFLKLNVEWLSNRHDELLEAVSRIKEYKAMKADSSKKRKAYASAKKTLISKKTELLAQRFEVQMLEGQIESMTQETENLDVAIDTVTSTSKRLRDNSLMDDLL